jgi:Lrp/AsnC family transcriptional regulator, leucine-responsive regulatory protein
VNKVLSASKISSEKENKVTLYQNGTRYHMDDTDWHILRELQVDARLSYSELGRRVGLSSPAVQERVRKMEDYGVIAGYHVEIDLAKVGLPLIGYVRVANMRAEEEADLEIVAKNMPEVLECHHIIGQDCYIMKIAAASIQHLEQIIGRLRLYNSTITSLVLSSPVRKRIISPSMAHEDERF